MNCRDDVENDDFESPTNSPSVVHSESLLSRSFNHTHSAQSAKFKAQLKDHNQRRLIEKQRKQMMKDEQSLKKKQKRSSTSIYTPVRSNDQQSLTQMGAVVSNSKVLTNIHLSACNDGVVHVVQPPIANVAYIPHSHATNDPLALAPLTEDQYQQYKPEDNDSVLDDEEESDDDEEVECDLDADVRHGEFDAFEVLNAFPGHDNLMKNRATTTKEEDLRGYRPLTAAVPDGFCRHCRCSKDKCHNKLFGLYCSLQVCVFIEKHHLHDLEQTHIIAEFERAYNVILKVKVCEKLHILDLQDNYTVPTCMQRHTKRNCLIIFRYRKWMDGMSKRIKSTSVS